MNRSEAGRLGFLKSQESLKARMEERIQKYNSDPKICPACKKTIPYEKRQNKYCNQSCSASKNNLGQRRHGKKPSNCLNCNKKNKSYDKKYCSMKCCSAYEWNEKKNKIKEGMMFSSVIMKKFLFKERNKMLIILYVFVVGMMLIASE